MIGAHMFLSPNTYTSTTIALLLSIFILILVAAPVGDCKELHEGYSECRGSFECGLVGGLSYPFWGGDRPKYCGHPAFGLICQEAQLPVMASDDGGTEQYFRLLVVNPDIKMMTLGLINPAQYLCPNVSKSRNLNASFLSYTDSNPRSVYLLYNCTDDLYLGDLAQLREPCPGSGKSYFFAVTWRSGSAWQHSPAPCKVVIRIETPWEVAEKVSVGGGGAVEGILGERFDVSYEYGKGPLADCRGCVSSGGFCGSNFTDPSRFLCFCQNNSSSPDVCKGIGNGVSLKTKAIIGAVAVGTAICFSIFTCYVCWRTRSMRSTFVPKRIGRNNKDLETFIRSHGPLAIKRFFSDVKKMTNSFKDKLGQGGYGSVYKGKLLDGRLVAVKILNASKGNGEEFINEVASISRTSHVNIVTLVGFCLEGSSRVLIYDFMPNGSLEKFTNKENAARESIGHLGWQKIFQIAVGVARGLEYLHRGCNTRIVHFDIKPHNILLNEEFCPKISDFGLARLCKNQESIMSMQEARGTIGYIAPEVFTRQFGGVSHKSDVYSYGMMILEMVGATENDGTMGDATSEYFPSWIYKRLELGMEHVLQGGTSAEEIENVRKMTIVGLWCIQTIPSDRPSISKVIEMLEGALETLKIPPQTFPSSPAKFAAYSSNTTDSLTL
ncbi:hypothetical protein Tsubulata_033672 [Turnera subulata]|uniref:non-specific serine/threonine protein kinase n=1 Tax=Turnera subulata TaxID=218843 RepID=A0A9Q0JG96_9ROSI|nr:hypothetical protein Tsubulata_033672 [Turnera subulata]